MRFFARDAIRRTATSRYYDPPLAFFFLDDFFFEPDDARFAGFFSV